MLTRSVSTRRAVKARLTSLRSRVCSGGLRTEKPSSWIAMDRCRTPMGNWLAMFSRSGLRNTVPLSFSTLITSTCLLSR